MRRLLTPAIAVAAVLLVATTALAERFINQHVRVEYEGGRKVIGLVSAEDEESLTLKIGTKGNTTTVDRNDVKAVESVEKLWLEIKKKADAARTGEDWYQVALAYEKDGWDKGTITDALERAIKVDTNHAAARKRLGYVQTKNERGETTWVDKKKAAEVERVKKGIKDTAEAMGDRPWDENRIVIRKPDKQPEYELITNCPKEVGEDYANFMVDLRKNLIQLIENAVKPQKITWQKNPCKTCSGSGKEGTNVCSHCGGRTQEPCKLFITNSHKFFMDITGSPEGLGGYYRPGYFPPGECDRPIVTFHGQFGTGNTFMVLAHEGTHQLEHLMWKGDEGSLFSRPGWLTEGLAVFFGDGLDMSQRKQGIFKVDIPRDRLAGLRRQVQQGQGKYYPVRMFTSLGIPHFQRDPGLYAYGWSLIYFMMNWKEKFKFNGKEIDLRESFGKFFMDNCERGALEEYRENQNFSQGAFQGLAKAMGITDPREAVAAIEELEKVWRDYLLKLPIKSVGAFDAKEKKKWASKDLAFEITLPGGKKKPKFDWQLMPEEDLVTTLLDEAMAFNVNKGEARAIVSVTANSESLDDLDAVLDVVRNQVKQRRFATYKELGDPVEGALSGASGLATVVIDFEGKERKFPGYVDNPRTATQKGKMLVCKTAKLIYTVIIEADADSYANYEAELKEILGSFGVTGG